MKPINIDPATLAVMQNALRQIVDEMDLALEKAAFNPVMSEARDRANGIYHPVTGDVMAQGDTGLPIFIGVMQFAVKSSVAAFPDLGPGDVVILNDPYCGGTHLMDVKLVRPFYYKGKRFAFLANCGHWTDIGGAVPGGFGVRATEIFAEGVRIPPMLLAKGGVMRDDLLDLLFANMRVPEERMGDLKAQVAALNVGEERLTALLDKYGFETVHAYMQELTVRSEKQMRAYVRGIRDGKYSFDTCLDSDGIVLEPIRVALDMHVKGEEITFDFSRSSPPVRGPLNGTLSATVAAVFVALKHIFPEVPVNAGIFRPVKVVAPETIFLNAQHPKAVSGSSAEVSLRVVDAVFGAMAQALPDRVPAACFGSVANFTISGFDPKRNKPYIMFRFSGGGYGGHPRGDGLSNGSAPISAARTSPVEVLEQLYPITFDSYRLRPGSGGPGEHRGGMGMEFQVRIRRGEALSSVLGDRGRFPPYGLHEGKNGQLAEVEYAIGHRRYRPEHVTKDEGIVLRQGDTARVATAGGGGWGNPYRRDPAAVVADVERGYITSAQARAQYGVVLLKTKGGYVVDEAQTAKARATLKLAGASRKKPAQRDAGKPSRQSAKRPANRRTMR